MRCRLGATAWEAWTKSVRHHLKFYLLEYRNKRKLCVFIFRVWKKISSFLSYSCFFSLDPNFLQTSGSTDCVPSLHVRRVALFIQIRERKIWSLVIKSWLFRVLVRRQPNEVHFAFYTAKSYRKRLQLFVNWKLIVCSQQTKRSVCYKTRTKYLHNAKKCAFRKWFFKFCSAVGCKQESDLVVLRQNKKFLSLFFSTWSKTSLCGLYLNSESMRVFKILRLGHLTRSLPAPARSMLVMCSKLKIKNQFSQLLISKMLLSNFYTWLHRAKSARRRKLISFSGALTEYYKKISIVWSIWRIRALFAVKLSSKPDILKLIENWSFDYKSEEVRFFKHNMEMSHQQNPSNQEQLLSLIQKIIFQSFSGVLEQFERYYLARLPALTSVCQLVEHKMGKGRLVNGISEESTADSFPQTHLSRKTTESNSTWSNGIQSQGIHISAKPSVVSVFQDQSKRIDDSDYLHKSRVQETAVVNEISHPQSVSFEPLLLSDTGDILESGDNPVSQTYNANLQVAVNSRQSFDSTKNILSSSVDLAPENTLSPFSPRVRFGLGIISGNSGSEQNFAKFSDSMSDPNLSENWRKSQIPFLQGTQGRAHENRMSNEVERRSLPVDLPMVVLLGDPVVSSLQPAS